MRFRRIAVMVATVVLTALAVATPASAATTLVTWEHHYKAGRGCLDHNFTQGVYNNICLGNDWQDWEAKQYADGTWQFKNKVTRMCLDASEYGVRGFGCNDLRYQRWRLGSWGGGWFELVSQYNNHCLDNSQHGMRTVGCNGLPYQLWAPTWRTVA
jgi:hypothetical protein